MRLETTETIGCEIDIEQIIKDYEIDRFTKYYELQKIAERALHTNWHLNATAIEALIPELVTQLAIKLKKMKEAPVSVEDLHYAWLHKKDLDYGKESFEVTTVSITNTDIQSEQIVVDTRFILNRTERKTVDQQIIDKALSGPIHIMHSDPVDVSAGYTYLYNAAGIIEERTDNQVIMTFPKAQKAPEGKTTTTKTPVKQKDKKPNVVKPKLIPEEKDDYDPFAGIIK